MSVFELAEKAKLTNVGIICTKSDVSGDCLRVQTTKEADL
jgi:hypothetical protein